MRRLRAVATATYSFSGHFTDSHELVCYDTRLADLGNASILLERLGACDTAFGRAFQPHPIDSLFVTGRPRLDDGRQRLLCCDLHRNVQGGTIKGASTCLSN